jgi:hypothetical protein
MLRGGGLCPRILAASALAAAGCGEAVCQSEVFLAFTQTPITVDIDDFAPGVQTSIRVRTSLAVGDVITLEIADMTGTVQSTVKRAVGVDGIAAFDYVTVPAPRTVLRATGSGLCGIGRDEIAVDVPVGAACDVQVVPEPDVNAYYAPAGVLAVRSDPDPVTPGFQSVVRVATRPGWLAELFAITDRERSLGALLAEDDGLARWPVTLADGRIGLRATCRGDGAVVASPVTVVVADTAPPSCQITAPAPGVTLTSDWDENHDLRDGFQIAVTGHAADTDVGGEPVALTITQAGGAGGNMAGTTNRAGAVTVPATFAPTITPATFDVSLTMHDHAGNACTSVASYQVLSTM